MSSFKIAKGGEEPPRPFVPENPTAKPAAAGFQAVPLAWDEPPPPAELPQVVEALPEEPPVPTIPEEEALARIEEAYQDGLRDGKLQAQAELSSLCESLGEALVKMGPLREELMQQSEEALLKLAVAIARKVTLREISLKPAILAEMASAAVQFATQDDEIVVRLPRNEFAQLADTPEYARLFTENKRISVKGDASLSAASCLVESTRGNIDAGVDSQLDEIMRRLLEETHRRKEEQSEGD